MKTVIHLRDQYLRVSFIYFLLKGFRTYRHDVLCREIVKSDLSIYPYRNIYRTSAIFNFSWLIDKVLTVKLGLVARVINDWYAYYFLVRKRKDILAIHAHMGPQGYYSIPLARKLKKPLFVTFYGADMSDIPKLPGWRNRYQHLFNTVTQVIVEGPHMKIKLIELGCPEEKVSVIKIGVPLSHLQYQFRQKYLPGQKLMILMCANFYPKKGYLKALSALSIMSKRGDIFEVNIVGDGPLKNKIVDFITDNNLSGKVFLHGSKTLPEIYELSKNHHLFFHPSETAEDGGSEGGAPTIIIEMQALGLPIIATTHADIPNIIPSDNHFLAEEYDVNGLVDQFDRLLAIDDWNPISERGREFVLEEHSNLNCSGKLELLYSKY